MSGTTTTVRTCEASSVVCDRPTMSPAASLCRRHAEALASGMVRSAAAFEEKLRKDASTQAKLARFGRRS